MIKLRMHHAGSGTHHLYISWSDDGTISHVILVLQCAFKNNRDNFHIVVRMHAESLSALYNVVVQHAQQTKMNPGGIMPVCKTETMMCIQPAMISMASVFCTMDDCFHF